MEHVIVERVFQKPMERKELTKMLGTAMEIFERHEVQLLHSYISKGGEVSVCHFAAPSIASVETANREAGLEFERIWIARLLTPEDD